MKPSRLMNFVLINMRLTLLYLCLISCSNNKEYQEYDEIRRTILKKEGIVYVASFVMERNGSERIETESIINSFGDISQTTYFDKNEEVLRIDEYEYDGENRTIKIKQKLPDQEIKVIVQKEYSEDNKSETVIEFEEGGTVSRTEYINDSLGRNSFNRFYRDSSLIAMHRFYWSKTSKLDSIVKLKPDGSSSGQKLIRTYEDGLLVSEEKYVGKNLLESQSYKYNENKLPSKDIFLIPNDFKYVRKIDYDNQLPAREISIYTSLTDSYIDTTKTIWRYHKEIPAARRMSLIE